MKIILGSLFGIFALSCFVDEITTANSALVPLCTGWLHYLPRAWPRLHTSSGHLCFTMGCLTILICGVHGFAAWICDMTGKSPWEVRTTLSITALFFTLLIGGMAMMGVAHQTAWLITAPVRLIERRHDANCASNMHQIGLALLLYSNDHNGAYPPDLATMIRGSDFLLSPWVFICDSSSDTTTDAATTQETIDRILKPGGCSYIYLPPAAGEDVTADRIILVEPPRNHAGDGMNVLFGDGHSEWVDRARAAAIFDQYHLADDGTPMANAKERK